mmetsp:Transcript_35286/g.87622  ORF Transcript_35286/g.87622 Transcript_35286/m.87622 type:complete len:176 (+) Transcript_35286:3737-4264(+)
MYTKSCACEMRVCVCDGCIASHRRKGWMGICMACRKEQSVSRKDSTYTQSPAAPTPTHPSIHLMNGCLPALQKRRNAMLCSFARRRHANPTVHRQPKPQTRTAHGDPSLSVISLSLSSPSISRLVGIPYLTQQHIRTHTHTERDTRNRYHARPGITPTLRYAIRPCRPASHGHID